MNRRAMTDRDDDMRKPSGQTVFLGAVVLGSCALVAYVVFFAGGGSQQTTTPDLPVAVDDDVDSDGDGENGGDDSAENTAPRRAQRLADIPFDGAKAYEYLKQICKIGRRPSGSEGMKQQQKLLAAHFEGLGGKVSFQRFEADNPLGRGKVPMANLIVEWHPERKVRVLLCAHYDTRPFPDQDRRNPRGTFIGANDGASGVGLLMEMGRMMPKLEGKYGVDFVLFDGEELIYPGRFGSWSGEYFLGSEHFARQYKKNPPEHKYAAGILLDMVGDADLKIYFERNSMRYKNTKKLSIDIWKVAGQLGVAEFVRRQKHAVNDDHLALNKIAKIPTCDIIDFDYPHWHTEGDTPDKCSALSLAKVGWVVHEWLVRINR